MRKNLIYQPKPDYYHVYWLEIALENFKSQVNIPHTIRKNTTIQQFVQKWAKDELSKIVDI